MSRKLRSGIVGDVSLQGKGKGRKGSVGNILFQRGKGKGRKGSALRWVIDAEEELEAAMSAEASKIEAVTSVVALICHTCNAALVSRSSGHQLSAGCHHSFCRMCLARSVAQQLLALNLPALPDDMQIVTVDDVLAGPITCPAEGCRFPLCREDLRVVLGPGILSFLDDCLVFGLLQNVLCPALHRCPNCNHERNAETLLLSPDDLETLEYRNIGMIAKRHAFNTSGGRARRSKSYYVETLREALAAASDLSLCPSCCCLICRKCGDCLKNLILAEVAAARQLHPHQCNPSLKQCFDMARSLLKLCAAYSSYVETAKDDSLSISSSRSGKKRGRDRPAPLELQSLTGCLQEVFGKGDHVHQNLDADHAKHGLDQHMLMNVNSVEQQNPTGGFEVESNHIEESDDDYYSEEDNDFTFVQQRVIKPTHAVDYQAQEALSELTTMLENLHNKNMSFLPPAIVAMLCSHKLPRQVLTWLVRNDSAKDIVARSNLYRQLMAFLRILSESSSLLPLLCSPQPKHDCWLDISRWETPGSVIADFRKLYTQAQLKLHGELRFEQYSSSEECDQQSAESFALMAEIKETYMHLLSRIRSWEVQTYKHEWLPDASRFFYDRVWKSLATRSRCAEQYDKIKSLCKRTTSGSSKKSALDHNQMLEAEYKKALGHLQFGEMSLLPSHYFRNENTKVNKATVNKKRARAIVEEITQLSTTLPLEWASSIFVRIDEQRYDMMRALIIGPADTPYQNGVFLFDIMFGEDYPHKPPKVQFLTTGGGRVSFNPNLYDSGHVCLSLLGTWSGPAWNPAESTLYQVLVSIQALVLVADPYYNEPGYKKPVSGQCQRGRHYMLDQRLNTLCYSILPALQTPDPIFEDAIRAHFRLKASEIQKQCDAWIYEETRESTRVQLIQVSKDVQQELAKLAKR